MFDNFKISAIAITAAMCATGAFAASINIGGGNGGLLNLGGDGGSTVHATVDLGNGGLLGLGGRGNDATVDVNLTDPNANTATVDLGNTLGTGGAKAVVDLGGPSTDGDLLNLFGTGVGGNEPVTAKVSLGKGGANRGSDADVVLDLFGRGSNDVAPVRQTSDVSGSGTGLSGPTLDLFGPANGGSTNGSGSDATGGNLFGPGNGGTDENGRRVTPIRIVATADTGGCFTPNATQVNKLASRHVYGDATLQGWEGASNLKVVDVGLCNGAGAAISANANVDRLQSFVAGNATLKTSLGKAGHAPDDVIAADKNGKTLTVYVM